jgi:hypothetical protein
MAREAVRTRVPQTAAHTAALAAAMAAALAARKPEEVVIGFVSSALGHLVRGLRALGQYSRHQMRLWVPAQGPG